MRSLTTKQAEAKGGVKQPTTQEADAAFRNTPSLEDWEPDLEKYPPELRDAYQRKGGA